MYIYILLTSYWNPNVLSFPPMTITMLSISPWVTQLPSPSIASPSCAQALMCLWACHWDGIPLDEMVFVAKKSRATGAPWGNSLGHWVVFSADFSHVLILGCSMWMLVLGFDDPEPRKRWVNMIDLGKIRLTWWLHDEKSTNVTAAYSYPPAPCFTLQGIFWVVYSNEMRWASFLLRQTVWVQIVRAATGPQIRWPSIWRWDDELCFRHLLVSEVFQKWILLEHLTPSS